MRMLLTALTLLLFTLSTKAQKKELFFDWNWKPTEPNTARYYAIVEKQDSVWHRQDYFLHEKRLQMDGYFKDAESKIEHGVFHYYHANGHIQSTGNYSNGKRQGVWLRFYDNGMMQDSATYEHGNVVGIRLGWYPNGYLSDSASLQADGSALAITWFDNGNPASAGLYTAGAKQHGKWKYFHKNGQPSAIEDYQSGILLSRQYFDESGNALSDTTAKEKEAQFPGGTKAWQKYLLKQLYFPSQYKIANADQAVVVVDWVVNEDGTVSDVKITSPLHPAFEKIAVEAIRKSPNWEPAISHNRAVKAYRRQPVTFAQ